MKHRFLSTVGRARTRIVAIAIFAIVGITTASASELEARLFIDGMIGKIRALEVPCPGTISELATSHDMAVVCARYEGDFDAFERRWRANIAGGAGFGSQDPATFPAAQPRTPWKTTGVIHERIYSIDETVVGVRFAEGLIVAVYKGVPARPRGGASG